MENKYEDIQSVTETEVLAAIDRGAPDELLRIAISVSMHHLNREFAEGICFALSRNPRPIVRGNAILGFGHLARRFETLDAHAKPLIEAALLDTSEYVRGQAWAAAGDVVFFLKWKINGFDGWASES